MDQQVLRQQIPRMKKDSGTVNGNRRGSLTNSPAWWPLQRQGPVDLGGLRAARFLSPCQQFVPSLLSVEVGGSQRRSSAVGGGRRRSAAGGVERRRRRWSAAVARWRRQAAAGGDRLWAWG